ncbi:MAG: bifunctional diguanylate cyclase/phosphodiesterase [Salaquimonas sp.]|nr:bifunctional diguanylate cyclase/phosphodiesterase [Salaquimonas sp.]
MKALLEYRKSAPLIDAAVLAAIGAALWALMVYADLYDWFYTFSRSHEDWELDELVLAAQTFGFMGFIYATRWLIAFRRELMRRRKAESDIEWLGHHDMLTRLPNRRFLADMVSKTPPCTPNGSTKCYAVYWLDLRGFKKVNELHGHGGGDRFLIEVVNRLKEIARNELIIRQGGDEFIVVADTRRIGDPHIFARKIAVSLERPVRLRSSHAQVNVYMGYAICPDHARTLKSGIKRAGFALNVAKTKGGQRVRVFEDSMEATLTEQATLELGLARAIRSKQIVPYYQPIFDLASGRLHAFEVLARWKRDGENIPPTVFIQIAEETGLIVELSEMLLRQACQDAIDWPFGIKISFNISGAQLIDGEIGKHIIKILEETGFPANLLEIEVTETALVADVETAEAVLGELRNAGATVALDDFGTGYSSLAQLSRFAFDVLKIDRSFVASFEHSAKQNKIVRAILALSTGLDIATTAEGIETQDQLDRLKKMGCRYGQGYLLGKPSPAAQLGMFIEADLAAHRKMLMAAIKKSA